MRVEYSKDIFYDSKEYIIYPISKQDQLICEKKNFQSVDKITAKKRMSN